MSYLCLGRNWVLLGQHLDSYMAERKERRRKRESLKGMGNSTQQPGLENKML